MNVTLIKQRLHLALDLLCLIRIRTVRGAVWKLGAGDEVDLVFNAMEWRKTRWQVLGENISVLLQKVRNNRGNIQRRSIIK